jgi:CBS domain-containing protein
MVKTLATQAGPRLTLVADSAADLMTPNPVSIRSKATVREAIALLIDKRIHAAPVIDDAGHPIGVLSGTDILIHDREAVRYLAPLPEFYSRADLVLSSGEMLPGGFQVEKPDDTPVGDLMTPTVFFIAPDATAAQAVEEMVGLKVHRLFVVDHFGVLVGVITALDVLRHLRPALVRSP